MTERELELLRKKRKLLAKQLAGFDEFVRGSVVRMKRHCTYRGCRKCRAGEYHPTWVLTRSIHGKTHTVYLGEKRLAKAKEMVDNYRRLMDLVEHLAEVNLELLIHEEAIGKGQDDGASKRGP